MILAAGFGTRMAPLTEERAKPALRLFDIPLIAWPMACLAAHGVRRLVVNLHHLPQTLEPELVRFSRQLGLELHLSLEEGPILGTAGGVGQAADLLLGDNPDTMLLLNSDTLFLGDLTAAGEAHRATGREASMLLQPRPAGGRYGLVQTTAAGRVVSIAGRPEPNQPPAGEWMFIGIHFFQPALLGRIPAGQASDINVDIYRTMIRQGAAVGGIVAEGAWLDFGTPRQFLHSTLHLLDAAAGSGGALPLVPPGIFDSVGQLYRGPGTRIPPETRLSRTVVGAQCRVAAGGRLDHCLLMEDCRLGREVVLEDCLVGPGTEIPDGFEARGRLLSRGADGKPPAERPLGEV